MLHVSNCGKLGPSLYIYIYIHYIIISVVLEGSSKTRSRVWSFSKSRILSTPLLFLRCAMQVVKDKGSETPETAWKNDVPKVGCHLH